MLKRDIPSSSFNVNFIVRVLFEELVSILMFKSNYIITPFVQIKQNKKRTSKAQKNASLQPHSY